MMCTTQKNGVCFDDFIFVIVHRWKLRRVSRNSRKNKRIGNKGAGLTIEWNRETGKGNITWFWWCWMRWRQENQEANGINSVGIPVFFIDVSLADVGFSYMTRFIPSFSAFLSCWLFTFIQFFDLGYFPFPRNWLNIFFKFNSIQKKRRKLNLAVFFHRGWVTCLVVCVAVTLVPGAGS